MKLVFLDTETTGLNPDVCEIWEIGAITRDIDGTETEYCWQLRPTLDFAEPTGLRIGRYYQRSRIHSHGVGSAMRIVHPDAQDNKYSSDVGVAAELALMLDGAYLIGAVPWFDERFLQRFLADNNQCATNHYHLIDVETLAAGQMQLPPPWDFDKLLAAYNLTYDEADRHTALGDARMVRDLYDAVMRAA